MVCTVGLGTYYTLGRMKHAFSQLSHTVRASFRKMETRGGKIIQIWGGGGKGTASDSALCRGGGGGGGHPPRKFLNFRPSEITSGIFSDHFWFLNDMR